MKRAIVSIAACCVLLFGLCGCGTADYEAAQMKEAFSLTHFTLTSEEFVNQISTYAENTGLAAFDFTSEAGQFSGTNADGVALTAANGDTGALSGASVRFASVDIGEKLGLYLYAPIYAIDPTASLSDVQYIINGVAQGEVRYNNMLISLNNNMFTITIAGSEMFAFNAQEFCANMSYVATTSGEMKKLDFKTEEGITSAQTKQARIEIYDSVAEQDEVSSKIVCTADKQVSEAYFGAVLLSLDPSLTPASANQKAGQIISGALNSETGLRYTCSEEGDKQVFTIYIGSALSQR